MMGFILNLSSFNRIIDSLLSKEHFRNKLKFVSAFFANKSGL